MTGHRQEAWRPWHQPGLTQRGCARAPLTEPWAPGRPGQLGSFPSGHTTDTTHQARSSFPPSRGLLLPQQLLGQPPAAGTPPEADRPHVPVTRPRDKQLCCLQATSGQGQGAHRPSVPSQRTLRPPGSPWWGFTLTRQAQTTGPPPGLLPSWRPRTRQASRTAGWAPHADTPGRAGWGVPARATPSADPSRHRRRRSVPSQPPT